MCCGRRGIGSLGALVGLLVVATRLIRGVGGVKIAKTIPKRASCWFFSNACSWALMGRASMTPADCRTRSASAAAGSLEKSAVSVLLKFAAAKSSSYFGADEDGLTADSGAGDKEAPDEDDEVILSLRGLDDASNDEAESCED